MDFRLPKSNFKHIDLLKDQVLGSGSYGTVYKAKCDDLICAAKCLHPILEQSTSPIECKSPTRRFEDEIHLLSTVQHPNIIQYLGVLVDPSTNRPVLLMELMDQSLTHYLSTTLQSVPFWIQVKICHDVALALSFLHSKGHSHRDLSSNNVLLVGKIPVKAKVADFGMAKDLKKKRTEMTLCPGTDIYMPPEAVIGNPTYDFKIDCFSFGVLAIQTITKKYPAPSERFRALDNSEESFIVTSVRIPEKERRKNHIDLVHPNHALLPIALDCLNDVDKRRPTAQHTCERIESIKCGSEYAKSVESMDVTTETHQKIDESNTYIELSHETKELRAALDKEQDKHAKEMKDAQLRIYHLEEVNATQEYELKQHKEETYLIKQLEDENASYKVELKQLEQKSTSQEQELKQLQDHLGEALHMKVSLQEQLKNARDSEGLELLAEKINLKWREGLKTECRLASIGTCTGVVKGNNVYLSTTNNIVTVYSSNSESWSLLPECPTSNFALVLIEDNLTVIGGQRQASYSNRLYTYNENEGSWDENYQPMPTRRAAATAISTQSVVIVAGGIGEKETVVRTVEVMDILNYTWSATVSLPRGRKNASMAACGHCIYFIGGEDNDESKVTVYASTLSALLQTREPASLWKQIEMLDRSRFWVRIADLPVTQTTGISYHGQLFAIGGRDLDSETVRSVYVYDPVHDRWETNSRMVNDRCLCFAAVLPDDHIIVIGGQTGKGFPTNVTEVAFSTV